MTAKNEGVFSYGPLPAFLKIYFSIKKIIPTSILIFIYIFFCFRYGSGYIISVRLSKPSEQDLLLELMKKEFPGCELMTRQYCSSQFSVPTDKTKISDMFKQMAKISEYVSVEDFNLVQSSLDQVNIIISIYVKNQNVELIYYFCFFCRYLLI